MNFLSLNICGMEVCGKDCWVRRMKTDNKVSLVALQETRVADLGLESFKHFWGNSDLEMGVANPRGRSGGLVIAWDPKIFDVYSSDSHQNFVLILGFIKEVNVKVNILNVYAPQGVGDKKRLWDTLLKVMNSGDGMWVCLGDFNAVRYPEERKNSVFKYSVAKDFNEFIDFAELKEYSMKGFRFTFTLGHGSDQKMRKIDRVLVCSQFFDRWPEACLCALPWYLSDHNPLLLTIDNKNYGARPFQEGPPHVNLIRKLKYLRSVLKNWKSQVDLKEKRGNVDS